MAVYTSFMTAVLNLQANSDPYQHVAERIVVSTCDS